MRIFIILKQRLMERKVSGSVCSDATAVGVWLQSPLCSQQSPQWLLQTFDLLVQPQKLLTELSARGSVSSVRFCGSDPPMLAPFPFLSAELIAL